MTMYDYNTIVPGEFEPPANSDLLVSAQLLIGGGCCIRKLYRVEDGFVLVAGSVFGDEPSRHRAMRLSAKDAVNLIAQVGHADFTCKNAWFAFDEFLPEWRRVDSE